MMIISITAKILETRNTWRFASSRWPRPLPPVEMSSPAMSARHASAHA